MTTEEERRERYAEMDRKMTELKASLDGMGERQRELDGRSREMRDRSREQLAEAREDRKRTRAAVGSSGRQAWLARLR